MADCEKGAVGTSVGAEAPTVSVILPIYNAAEYVEAGIRSLMEQTLRDIEIICVDDGSSDDTGCILNELAREDNRLVVIHKENGGAGAARNAGLAVARGEYLSILDIDDFFEGDMLERALAAARADDLDIVVFRSDEYYVQSGEYKAAPWAIHENLLPAVRPFAATDVPRDVFKLFVGWSWDKLIRRSLVEERGLRFQEIRTTNDMLFVFSAVIAAPRIGVMDDVLVHHRKDDGSLSVTREKSWGCFYEALIALRAQLLAWGVYDRFEQDYLNYCVHAALWNVRTLAEPTKSLLTQKLADEWFDELGVPGHPASYYYNKPEYGEFLHIYDPAKARLNDLLGLPRATARRFKRLFLKPLDKGEE